MMENNKLEISEYGALLVYKNGYDREFVERAIEKNGLNGLRIWTDPMKNPPPSLDFLEDFIFLMALDVTSLRDYDFGFLRWLVNLKKLSIYTQGVNEIDLSNQKKLKYLVIEWRKGKVKGLQNCQNLRTLSLVDYKEENFVPISVLSQLRNLRVKTGSIRTVEGVSAFRHLESLLLGNCRSLHAVSGLNGLNDLKSLEINTCSKVEDYDKLIDLPGLEELRLINCKGIESIAFVKNFPRLRKLVLLGNTRVLDGNMLPAQNIEEVRYST